MFFKKDEIQQLNSLEREKQDFEKELTLDQAEAQLIKDYVMKQGAYKVIITIYELNDLEPKSLKLWNFQLDEKTACDSLIEVTVNNQIKKTQIKPGTNNPIFDEQFYFEFPQMSVEELDRGKISFSVYDTKFWGQSQSLIGCFELDWTNVYFKRNHEIYRAWLTLYDPNNELDGPVGYLLANIAVLGPNDQITIHDSAFIKDPLVTIEDTITSPKLPLIDYSISIQIYRAEGLIPLDLFSSELRAYVIAKFSGNKIKTSSRKSLNPEWNQRIKIGTQVPNKSKYITLEVRNKNLFSKDDIIGVLKVPFIDILDEQDHGAKWGHLYGPPLAGKDVEPNFYATKMQVYGDKIGSHYRGRLLYKVLGKKDVYTKNIKNKLIFKFPYRVVPVIPVKLYLLRIDLIEGFGFPFQQFCYIHICMGEYTIKTKKYLMKDGFCEFFDMLEEKKINLSQNLQSIPDLIIYFSNGLNEQNRIGFLRVKASQIMNRNALLDEVKVYELKFDKSTNHKEVKGSCGNIACRLQLLNSSTSNPSRKKITEKMKIKEEFQLRVFLYRGQNFPPANQTGDCDPLIKFSMDQTHFQSNPILSTYNPIWNQVISSTVTIQNLFNSNMEKCLICDAYDYQKSQKHNYLGTFSIRLNSLMKKQLKLREKYNNQKIQFIYFKPKWHYVVNPNIQIGNPVFGKVLISCCIFKKTYEINGLNIEFLQIQKNCKFNQIKTQNFTKNINLYLIGIRDLKSNQQEGFINSIKRKVQRSLLDATIKPEIRMNCQVDEKIPLRSTEVNQNIKQKEIDQQTEDSDTKSTQPENSFKLKNSGCQVNRVYNFVNVEIPKNKQLSTFAQFKITDERGKYIYGSNSVNLKSLRNILDFQHSQNKNEKTIDDNILDVEDLQVKLKKLQVLNKIKQDINSNEQAAKYISKNRFQFANPKNLIVPSQLPNKKQSQSNIDIQEEIQMDKLIKEFEQELDHAEDDQDNQYAYIKHNISSSSNNFVENMKSKDYNSIDDQNEKLSKRKNKMSRMQQPLSIEIIEDENQSLIQGPLIHKQLTQANRIPNLSHQPNGFSKNLIRQYTDKNENTKLLKSDNQQNFFKTKDSPSFQTQSKPNLQYASEIAFTNLGEGKNPLQNQRKNQVISNFDLNQSLMFTEVTNPEKVIKYSEVEKGLKMQEQHQKQAIQKQQQYKYAHAVKLSLFKWMRKQQQKSQKQTYEDFDTDEEENLDIIPEWYKGRKILSNDLQSFLESSRKIINIPIYRGRKIEGVETRVKEKVGTIKMVTLSEDTKDQLDKKAKQYENLLRQKQFSCRIYVLKGKTLLTKNLQKPNTYLKFIYGQKVTTYKDRLVKNEINPQYYFCHEQWVKLPGPSTIRIQVIEATYLVGNVGDMLVKDKMIGFTEIDVEDRYFMKKWHLLERKPIELRNLFSEYGIGTQGRLETWIDLVQKKRWLVDPVIKITPPPWDEYELRVIAWGTKDCVFKNQLLESNDIFVRGQIGKSSYQQTDVHWSCRSVGAFNYRFKFPVFYPPKPEDMYSDIFIVQIWDKDVIGFDNLIGQTRINLNKMHKLIQKAVKRKKPVSAIKKIIEKNMKSTDKFWFDVFNHKEKDQFGLLQSQGRVQLSFELVPMEMAKNQRANGYGRSEPNVYPTLAEPAGRLSFNFLQPLNFLKQLLGPNLYRSVCIKLFLLLFLILIILIFVLFGTSILAGLVTRK